jgi:hypothetical protein
MNFSRWKVGFKSALIGVVVFLMTASFLYIVILKLIYLIKLISK